jgi:dynein heavy chain 1
VDLADFAEPNISPKNPIMLVSAPGFDASYKVEALAKLRNKKYTAVAMGSPEAFDQADKAIRAATKSGQWVLLKNVHLVTAWLSEVEKKIYNTEFRGKDQMEFRLFLTMENNPKVPSTLLKNSQVLVFEPPAGIKAALIRSYAQSVTVERTEKEPIERKRLHFLVSWFNAVVQERLRYTPIGWSKVYEFNESDFRCSLDCVDEWIDNMGKGRKNVDPDKIPWDALRALIAQSVFGGKIDNEFDNKILQSLVD